MVNLRTILLTFTILTFFVNRAQAETINVPGDFPTIQIAIQEAQPFDTIIVAPGTYFEAINFLGKVIIVQSENPTDPETVANTIIDAGGLGKVVTFQGGEDQENTALMGFTITGGTIGIEGNDSPAGVRYCVVEGNTSHGIEDLNGRIEDTIIRDNGGNGLMRCDGEVLRLEIRDNNDNGMEDCTIDVHDSSITDNRLYGCDDCTLEMTNSRVSRNGHGGIFRCNGGSVSRSIISGNEFDEDHEPDEGNGFYQSSIYVQNCVIAGNHRHGLNQCTSFVQSCTVTGNREYGFRSHGGNIEHVILWDNTEGSIQSSMTPLYSGTSNPFFVAPGFFDLNDIWVDGDYHLTPNSPYLDAGNPGYGADPNAPELDFDGNARVVGRRIDIGALEFQQECAGEDFDGDGQFDICDGDIDNDGVPNIDDLCDFTPEGSPVDAEGRPHADLNLDCKVNLADYAILQQSFDDPE